MSDVRVRPGTHGKYVVAALGWRGGTLPDDTRYNGFYVSTTGGTAGSFHKVTPAGIASAIGRSSLAYSANGNKLYAVVEASDDLDLNGVYRSDSGTADGPWTLIADDDKLAAAPGTESDDAGGQSWYDQYVTVDPKDASHVYLGLTEVYETSDSGKQLDDDRAVLELRQGLLELRPVPGHLPGHHARRPARRVRRVRRDGVLRQRRRHLQPPGRPAREGQVERPERHPAHAAVLRHRCRHGARRRRRGLGRSAGQRHFAAQPRRGADGLAVRRRWRGRARRPEQRPAGGQRVRRPDDGPDPERRDRSDGSTSSYTTITPTCATVIAIEYDPQPCDPNPRFIAPYTADPKNIDHWVGWRSVRLGQPGRGLEHVVQQRHV